VMARPIPERFMAVPFRRGANAFTIRWLDRGKKPPKVSPTVTLTALLPNDACASRQRFAR
jgi:hypothetical protein